jgi:hypothetical protein
VRALALERTRRLAGWGLVLVVVVGLRVAGLGAPPPKVGATALVEAAPDPATAQASRAFGFLVADVDRSPSADGTERCLGAGAACSPDDVLSADTTRLLLATVADALHSAADPADPGYLGEPSPEVERWAADLERTARAGAGALDRFLSSGCAGSIDGVAAVGIPDSCHEQVAGMHRALDAFDAALAGWRGGAG